jgi:hypothetical protein
MPEILTEIARWNAHVRFLQNRYLMLYPATRPLTQSDVRECLVLLSECRRSGQFFPYELRKMFIPTQQNS